MAEDHPLHGELAAREGVGHDALLRSAEGDPDGGAGAAGLADHFVVLVEEFRAEDGPIALGGAMSVMT